MIQFKKSINRNVDSFCSASGFVVIDFLFVWKIHDLSKNFEYSLKMMILIDCNAIFMVKRCITTITPQSQNPIKAKAMLYRRADKIRGWLEEDDEEKIL